MSIPLLRLGTGLLLLGLVNNIVMELLRLDVDSRRIPAESSVSTGMTALLRASSENASRMDKSKTSSSPVSVDKTNSERRLAVIGMARDVARHLNDLQRGIQETVENNKFELVQLVFYENDSRDRTVQILQTWNETAFPGLVTVLSESGVPGTRTERLSHGRNRLLRFLDEISPDLKVDYVLNLDMDEVNSRFSGVDKCLDLPDDWAICCANNYRAYYDVWPLRTYDDWWDCDFRIDCSICVECAPKNQYKHRTHIAVTKMADEGRYRHIPALHDPIPVKSCFGGAALMNFDKIKPVLSKDPYFGTKQVEEYNVSVCEHVSFNQAVLGAFNDTKPHIYIQPPFLNIWTSDGTKELFPEINASRFDPKMRHFYERFYTPDRRGQRYHDRQPST